LCEFTEEFFLNFILFLGVPWNVDYADSQYGARLSVFAIAGKQVINDYKIKSEKQCVHIYGTTLDTKWSPIDC